jgi:hypothetical protein
LSVTVGLAQPLKIAMLGRLSPACSPRSLILRSGPALLALGVAQPLSVDCWVRLDPLILAVMVPPRSPSVAEAVVQPARWTATAVKVSATPLPCRIPADSPSSAREVGQPESDEVEPLSDVLAADDKALISPLGKMTKPPRDHGIGAIPYGPP